MAKNKHKRNHIAGTNKMVPKRINKGYSETGASRTRKSLKGFTASSGSPNEDINYNNMTLRKRSRVLAMSGGIPLSALKTNRTNVIGCGLILKSQVDRDVLGLTLEEANIWQKQAEREFALWAEKKENCDSICMNDFYKIQQLVFYSALLNGDSFAFIQRDESAVHNMSPYSLRLNIIEADRVATPDNASCGGSVVGATDGKAKNGNRIYDGVEVNEVGKVLAYHVRNNYLYEINAGPTKWTRVEAYGNETGLPNVIHVMADVERAGQYRGVSLIAPVLEMVLQIRQYTNAELTAALVESLFTAFVTTEARTDEMPFNQIQQEEESLDLDDDEYEMGPGNINVMKPGESITFGDPKRPAGGFSAFVEAVAVQIGASLEIPKEMLLKQFNSSYSASRAALLEFWKLVKMRREWFVSDFCRPIYEIFMYEAVARGRLNAPGFFDDPIKRMAWLGAEFTGPAQGMLDPTKEITAEQMMCENGFSTRAESAIRLNGSEYNKNVDTLKDENKSLEEAKRVEAQTNELVSEYRKQSVKTGDNNET